MRNWRNGSKNTGFKEETEASITNEAETGARFRPRVFLACLAALELDGVALEEI